MRARSDGMVTIKDKQNCCGCSACVQVCPKQCISLKEDTEGFLYPDVHPELCISCGLCNKVCPIESDKTDQSEIFKGQAYYAINNNLQERLDSSSGGIFTLIAKKLLLDGGIIIGCAFDEEYMAHHIVISDVSEISRLQGSKYLQSRIENTYTITKRELDAGRTVLFSGTACQIAGLKGYLNREYENLYTVDVLCHGVPSPKLWKLYLQEKLDIGAVQSINFRDKTEGWKKFSVKIIGEKEIYRENLLNDRFMQLFLNDICLRPSCYACKFKGINRISDITLGDAWGIETHSPELDDDAGASIVLVHSPKGSKLLESVKSQITLKVGEVDSILSPTADSRKSVAIHKNRNKFFKNLGKGCSISELCTLLNTETVWHKIKWKLICLTKNREQ